MYGFLGEIVMDTIDALDLYRRMQQEFQQRHGRPPTPRELDQMYDEVCCIQDEERDSEWPT